MSRPSSWTSARTAGRATCARASGAPATATAPTHAELLPPGEVAEIEVDLIATANVFRAGHRIRLEVAASNWPRFDVNSQTGGPIAGETELRAARQTVLHDAAHPSRLHLPIVPA